MNKICTVCKQEKSIDDFYPRRRRGKNELDSQCKECRKADQRDYHHNRGGKETQKEYRKTENGKLSLGRANSNYEKSEKGKSTRSSYCRKLYDCRGKRNIPTPEERKLQRQARNFVNGAIRFGKLKPATNFDCVICKNNAKEYHHNMGYEREHWLDVIPVCVKCHRNLDLHYNL